MYLKTLAILGTLFNQSPLTADEAVSRMLRSHPRVQALVHDIRATQRGLASANSFANPELTVTPGFTAAGSDEELLISQPLEINGTRRARAGVARARVDGAREQGRLEVAELIFATRTAFNELFKASERRRLTQQLMTTSQELDRIAERQVELGTRAGTERNLTRIELHRASQQAQLAEAEWQAAAAALNNLIGAGADGPIQPKALEFVPAPVDEAGLVAAALENHPGPAVLAAERSAFDMEARLAKAEGNPDISPQFRMESFTREPRQGGFGIAIKIPIIDYGARRNRILQAEESARAQELRLTAARNQVRLGISQAVFRLRAAETLLREFKDGMMDEAKQLFEATQRGFQLGQSTITALLEAQRTYRTVETEYIDALVSHHQAKAQLDRAVGTLPEDQLPTELRKKEVRR
ncbi:MAG: Cobalt-zinc-cadmium resistance protein CzcC [Fimbriimonadaceae bacterium]|nr:Cobalt-zinc-cadmium resistance protein CzcC [Fimbriimonadaceae bacterium]